MGNDKTSWLNLDDDDADLGGETHNPFTETLPGDGGGQGPTYVPHDSGASDMRTVLEDGVEKTQIYLDETAGFDEDTDPVVGWLVVVSGPGLGNSITLGAGMNTLGRDPDTAVSLPFGDNQISANDHLRVIYDDEARAFFVAPGSGRNVSRINGQIIATTMSLPNHAILSVSKKTHLKFVAFCDESFDWSDLAGKDS